MVAEGYYYPWHRTHNLRCVMGKARFIIPAALTAVYAILTMRMDENSILDYIKCAWRYFISTQQYFEWRES